ncbi:hypothetical protein LCGC14_0565540 [marine sediment metagenome]|uniref:Helix-turn-helix domain-containing protein n=1 Tax=marine sediment metagenome TaxID=412755 RepID=A0A0F9S489_9ZZZZ
MGDSSDQSKEWLTTKEAAGKLNKSVRYVRTMIQEGKLRARRDGNKWLIHESLSPPPEETEGPPSETAGNTRETLSILKAQLEAKDTQIAALQERLAAADGASERHDTIVLQLTRQVEQSQRLLEYQSDPWYRRMFRKGRKPPEGREND